MTQIKLTEKNFRLIRDITGIGTIDIQEAVKIYNSQVLDSNLQHRILACNDLESLKLELIKVLTMLNVQVVCRYPMDKLVDVIGQNLGMLECETL